MEKTIPEVEGTYEEVKLPRITFGWTWLIILPAAVWGIAYYYLPIVLASLDQLSTWLLTLVILLLMVISLAGHLLAHLAAARLVEKKLPSDFEPGAIRRCSPAMAKCKFQRARGPHRKCRPAYESPADRTGLPGLEVSEQ